MHFTPPCTNPSHTADSIYDAPEGRVSGEAVVAAARRMFGRTLQAWAMDVLRLQARGLDRPRACPELALLAGPAAPPHPKVARDVRQAA
ncbi:MAG: hypothetical protein KDA20_02000 [Phycisphaerales bacterium]|nr:hypothetical protein [Phycisphaerales bacterium]